MISIIVVGYNSKKDLRECFDSIYTSTYEKYRIIFVDNDSSDGSLEYVKNKYPNIITIKNKNTGYAGGNNVGINKAIDLKSKYVFLLNPDTIIDKNCLGNLIKKADDGTILQPLILLNVDSKNTDLINTTGGHLNFLGFSYCSDYKRNRAEAKEKDLAIASGAAAFIPTTIFNKIGLFDESFFMYHEDVDLFWRARLMGFNIRLIPDSIVWHKYSFSKNRNKMFYAERNRLLFLYHNFSFKYRLLIFPAFLINEIMIILYSIISGWGWAKLKAYFSFFTIQSKEKTNKDFKKQLLARQSLLKIYINPEISFSEVKNPLFSPYNLLLRIYWKLIYVLI